MKRLLGMGFMLFAIPALVAAQPAESVEYYGQDAIGSIRIVWDANGNVLGRQDFAPFGRPLFPAASMPKEGFGGQEKDHETEQGYFHARMFHARTGRFTRPDPIGAGLFRPQGWNRYAYALNSATNTTDYTGLCPTVICPEFGVTVVGHADVAGLVGRHGGGGAGGAGDDAMLGITEPNYGDDGSTGGTGLPTEDPTTEGPPQTPPTNNPPPKPKRTRPTIAPVPPDKNAWDAFRKGCLQGAEAMIDGAIPFADPFADRGLYDVSNSRTPGLYFSREFGGASLQYLVLFGGARLVARATYGAARGTISYRVAHNPYVRIGYHGGKPRIAMGPSPHPDRFHIPLICFGK